MHTSDVRYRIFVRKLLLGFLIGLLFGSGNVGSAQLPGLPTGQGGADSKTAAPVKPKKEVAAATGPITVQARISDQDIQQFLAKFLPKYPGIRTVRVSVDDGVVTLNGRIDEDASRDEITDVVRRVEGV